MLENLHSALGLALISVSATAPQPLDPAHAIVEFSTYCANSRPIWRKSLCGPLLFVDPATKTAVASFNPGVAGFHREGPVWVGPLPPNIGIANTSVEIAGKRVAEILLPLPADALERRILISHESFHRIQPALGFKGAEADNGHLDERDARIYARLEVEALKAALTRKTWRAAAREALSYRAARMARYPQARAAEGSLIANEGIAEYTGLRVGAGVRARSVALQRLDGVTDRPSLIRSFGYVVGPAYGLLLDRTNQRWRTAALKGEPMPDLLANALGGRVRQQPAMARYGGARIAAEETARDSKIQARKSELTARLVDGPTVTFAFESMNIDFNPNTVFALGDAGNVYSQATKIRDHWGALSATGELLLSPDWKFARAPGPARIDGRTVSGPGWSAELAPGYSMVPGDRPGDYRLRKD
ncbi:MAG: hypothetical protein ABIW33_06525 [Sphingomicrobium sp.]